MRHKRLHSSSVMVHKSEVCERPPIACKSEVQLVSGLMHKCTLHVMTG